MSDKPVGTACEIAHAVQERIAAIGSDASNLEAELLMAEALGLGRAALLARWRDYRLSSEELRRWDTLLKRRLHGEPLAYILGRREFYGLTLHTDHRALIPRPETELLVEASLNWCKSREVTGVADIGTGSGAIAIALAHHLPLSVRILATDISRPALALAEENARATAVANRIEFLQGMLAAPLPVPVDCMVANLPYIDAEGMTQLPLHIGNFEPHVALYGGPDGLSYYRRLFHQIVQRKCIKPGGALFCEIGANQGEKALDFARCLLPMTKWKVANDLAGHTRMLYSEAVYS